jgi:hypothetical protein
MPYALTLEMLILLLKAFQKVPSVFGGHLISTNIPSPPSWKRVGILVLLLNVRVKLRLLKVHSHLMLSHC